MCVCVLGGYKWEYTPSMQTNVCTVNLKNSLDREKLNTAEQNEKQNKTKSSGSVGAWECNVNDE